jgi:Asp/Glu/hydantoin racemase
MPTEPFIGVLMLDTSFERIVGDAGNPASYSFPVRIAVIPNADPTLIVLDHSPAPELVQAFCSQAQSLQAAGAIGIVSTCGFLIHVQDEIAAAVDIPVLVSPLSLGPLARSAVSNRRIGVITASAAALGPNALAAAGLTAGDVSVVGLDDEPAFARVYTAAKGSEIAADYGAIESAVTERANRLARQSPSVGAIILECANLPTYKAKVAVSTGLPVFDILNCAQLLWSVQAGTNQ